MAQELTGTSSQSREPSHLAAWPHVIFPGTYDLPNHQKKEFLRSYAGRSGRPLRAMIRERSTLKRICSQVFSTTVGACPNKFQRNMLADAYLLMPASFEPAKDAKKFALRLSIGETQFWAVIKDIEDRFDAKDGRPRPLQFDPLTAAPMAGSTKRLESRRRHLVSWKQSNSYLYEDNGDPASKSLLRALAKKRNATAEAGEECLTRPDLTQLRNQELLRLADTLSVYLYPFLKRLWKGDLETTDATELLNSNRLRLFAEFPRKIITALFADRVQSDGELSPRQKFAFQDWTWTALNSNLNDGNSLPVFLPQASLGFHLKYQPISDFFGVNGIPVSREALSSYEAQIKGRGLNIRSAYERIAGCEYRRALIAELYSPSETIEWNLYTDFFSADVVSFGKMISRELLWCFEDRSFAANEPRAEPNAQEPVLQPDAQERAERPTLPDRNSICCLPAFETLMPDKSSLSSDQIALMLLAELETEPGKEIAIADAFFEKAAHLQWVKFKPTLKRTLRILQEDPFSYSDGDLADALRQFDPTMSGIYSFLGNIRREFGPWLDIVTPGMSSQYPRIPFWQGTGPVPIPNGQHISEQWQIEFLRRYYCRHSDESPFDQYRLYDVPHLLPAGEGKNREVQQSVVDTITRFLPLLPNADVVLIDQKVEVFHNTRHEMDIPWLHATITWGDEHSDTTYFARFHTNHKSQLGVPASGEVFRARRSFGQTIHESLFLQGDSLDRLTRCRNPSSYLSIDPNGMVWGDRLVTRAILDHNADQFGLSQEVRNLWLQATHFYGSYDPKDLSD